MTDRQFDAVTFSAAAAAAFLVWGPWPLGVPGEWAWHRFDGATVLSAVVLAAAAAAYLFAVDRTAGAGRWSGLMLTGLGFAFLTATLWAVETSGTAAGATREPWVLALPSVSGYLDEAARDGRGVGEWLAGYEAETRGGDVLHQGTHPPGLILLWRGLLAAVEAVPPLQSVSRTLSGPSWRESAEVMFETAVRLPEDGPSEAAFESAAWWGAKLTRLAVAACAVPLVWLMRPAGPEAAHRLAGLWPLVPAAAVFLPKSDCLYALPGLLVAAGWCRALERRSPAAAAASGAAAGAALWLSLAPAPLYAGVAAGSLVWARGNRTAGEVGRLTAAGAGGVLATVAAGWLSGVNLPAVWAANLRNHAGFYDAYPRTYAAWLPVNGVEAVVAASLPVVAACVAWRRGGPRRSLVACVAGGALVAWAGLWLSGKNMGEAARLWVLLTPWPLVWLSTRTPLSPRRWRSLGTAAGLALAAVASVVDGFSLGTAGN